MNPLLSLLFLVFHLLGVYQYRAWLWDGVCFEFHALTLNVEASIGVVLLGHFSLVTGPEVKRLFVSFRHSDALLLDPHSPLLISLCDGLVSWLQHFRWDGLAPEHFVHSCSQVGFPLLLFKLCPSLFNTFRSCSISGVERKWSRNSDPIFTFLGITLFVMLHGHTLVP